MSKNCVFTALVGSSALSCLLALTQQKLIALQCMSKEIFLPKPANRFWSCSRVMVSCRSVTQPCHDGWFSPAVSEKTSANLQFARRQKNRSLVFSVFLIKIFEHSILSIKTPSCRCNLKPLFIACASHRVARGDYRLSVGKVLGKIMTCAWRKRLHRPARCRVCATLLSFGNAQRLVARVVREQIRKCLLNAC